MSEVEVAQTDSGNALDSYINTIDMDVSHMLDEIRDVDVEKIPSKAQRESFKTLIVLLESVCCLTGPLRYDVCAEHDRCPEHDDYARRCVAHIKERITA